MVNLGTRALVKVEDSIWFSASNFNGLFKLNIYNLEIEFVHRFQYAEVNQALLHSGKIIHYNNELYIFPYYSNVIVSYNISTKEENIIEIPDVENENLVVNVVWQSGTEIYFYGDTNLRFYVLDLELKKVKKHELGKEIFSKFSSGQIGWGEFCNDRILIVLQDKNEFIEVKDNICMHYNIPNYFRDLNLFRVYYDGKLYWLVFFESTDIYSWDIKTQELERYTLDDSVRVEVEKFFYHKFWSFEKDFFVVGNSLCGIFQIDREVKKIKEVCKLPKEFKILSQKDWQRMPFEQYVIVNKELWMFPVTGNKLVIYNSENSQTIGVDFSINGRDIPDGDIIAADICIKNKNIIMEELIGLEEYLWVLKNIKENKEE